MNIRSFILVSISVLAAAAAGAAQGATAGDGLAPIHSWRLDELYLRPGSDLASYRKIMLDPTQVAFRKDFNRSFADSHQILRRLSAEDTQRIADDAAANMERALADSFRARGYEVVSVPGPGVLRLSPSVTELYVNAAEELQTGGTTKSFTKDAGEATLILDVRDAASGALLGRIVDRRTVQETKGTQGGDLIRTSVPSNNFYFDQTFRRWAGDCITEFQAPRSS
jgi:hypothetical protein